MLSSFKLLLLTFLFISGITCLPNSGFSEALSKEDREQALQLFSVALQCPAPAVKTEISSSMITNKLEVDGTIVRLKVNNKIYEMYPEGQDSQYSGEEYDQDSVVFFDYSHIETVKQIGDRISVNCKDGRRCIAIKSYVSVRCPVTHDGFISCGNISASSDLPPTGESNYQFFGICSASIEDAVFGLQVLIAGDLPAINDAEERTEGFRVGDAYSDFAIPIRIEPDIHSMTVGAVPPDSGIIRLANCREIEGSQSEWCEISWGGVSGWISKKKLVPAQ